MLRTLDRYVLRTFLSNYVLSLFVLISLYVVLDLFVNFDEFTESSVGLGNKLYNIFDYYLYNLPLYFSMLSGVITAFAACATLARLKKQNEMTAVLASGTSLYRLAAPIIMAGLVMNGLLILDQELLLPRVAPKLARERDDVEGMRSYGIWCIRDGENRLVSAEYFQPKLKRVRNFIVLELNKTPTGTRQLGDVIHARKARWDEQQHGWVLEDAGRRITLGDAAAASLREEANIERLPLGFYPTELTPEEMLARQSAQWVQFLSLRQLNMLRRQSDVDPNQIDQIKHGRFTLPINNMILLLLGISFFMTRLPENVLTQGAKALAATAAAFIVVFIGQQFVGTVGLWPALPAWLPIFIFLPIAVLLLDNVKT